MENTGHYNNIPRKFTQADVKQIARMRMVRSALILSVVAMLLFSTGYFSLIPAGVAFITALVSLGESRRPTGGALVAMLLALAAIVLSYLTIVYTFIYFIIPAIQSPEAAGELNAVAEQMYGVSFTEMIATLREQLGFAE